MSKPRQRQRNIRVKADHVTDCVCSSLPSLQRVKRAGLHTVCAMVWLGAKHAESALEGADCSHYEWLPLRMLHSRGENSLWGGSFHQRSSQYLPRFHWGGAVVAVLVGIAGGSDGGNEDGRAPFLFLSHQIQRPFFPPEKGFDAPPVLFRGGGQGRCRWVITKCMFAQACCE